jgi:hypothetical protein
MAFGVRSMAISLVVPATSFIRCQGSMFSRSSPSFILVRLSLLHGVAPGYGQF